MPVGSFRALAIAAGLLLAAAAAVCAQAPVRVRWADALRQADAWYESEGARTIAESVLQYQRESGGWPKDLDMSAPPTAAAPARPDATIDNGATTTQIRFLARVPGRRYHEAAVRGIEYLLRAQYPNGGWPQFFPLRSDYSRHITFNDDAMVNVVTLLDDVAAGRVPFASTDATLRRRAAAAVGRALPLVLTCQVVVGGTPTAWAAQYDAETLEPRPARAFEPVALAAAESTGVARWLMRQPKTPAIARAVDAAVVWFKATALPDGRWARFYEIGTNRPIFAGRDGIVRYSVDEIERERQEGYAWHGTWPRALLDREYARWQGGISKD